MTIYSKLLNHRKSELKIDQELEIIVIACQWRRVLELFEKRLGKIDYRELSEEEFQAEIWLDEYHKEREHQSKCSLYEAIEIFKGKHLFKMCYEHIEKNDHKKEFEKILRILRSEQNDELNIEKAREYPIEKLLIDYGCMIKRNFCKSPFMPDQKTGSLKIYPETNSWYCFASGRGGSPIDFVIAIKGCNTAEAIKFLA